MMSKTSIDFHRRRFVKSVSAGALGFGLADLLALENPAAQASAEESKFQSLFPQAKNILVVYEEGGISQMDSWDPKPNQTIDHRSPYAPISTNVSGIQISSLMPKMSQHIDKLSIVRSMTTAKVAGHMQGCQEFFKGYRFNTPTDFPDIGSVVVDQLGSECGSLPGYIFAPGANMPNHITGPGFLHKSREAWKLGTKSLGENVAAPDWKVRALQPQADMNSRRLGQRAKLLNQLDGSAVAQTISAKTLSIHYEKAFDLLTNSQVQLAFDFSVESEKTKDRYGRGHRGLSYLLGRKLIEVGVRFVTVTVIQPPELVGRPGYGQPNGVFLNWDHHEGIYRNGPCGGPQAMSNSERYGICHDIMMPSTDQALSALLEDMEQRGLLDETLVCFITEMGRTPRINKWEGRDHWGRALSIAFAGAGVPGGQVIGATDKEGGDVIENRYTPYDYAETVYRKLGIETNLRLHLPDGRPIEFSDGGKPIRELFS